MTAVAKPLAARLTPAGPAALATIGLRGHGALALAADLFRSASGQALVRAAPGRPYYGVFGATVHDDVVVRLVAPPPLAEIEIHCHGGAALVEALLADLVAAGAQRGSWEEYERARGASEVALEAMAALAQCRTERAAAVLLDQYNGALETALALLTAQDDDARRSRLLGWARFGIHLVEPWRVLLFGRPNVGKSSLLNALAGFERAIVSPIAGTTRDVLGAECSFDGWPVELLDGAGLEAATLDPLELEGRQRLAALLPQVDLRILVLDLSQPLTDIDRSLEAAFHPELVIGNKSDLAEDPVEAVPHLDWCGSARTGAGIGALGCLIARRLVPAIPAPGEPVPFTQRQIDWLSRRSAAEPAG